MEVEDMRQGIHPGYVEAIVHCSCGNTFTTRSTRSELHVELCDLCHPFYTGQQKFVDTGGRVQRFSDKFGSAAETVIAKETAAKEARQKAHEESVIASRQAREIKEREEAEIVRKAAARAPKAEAVVEIAPEASPEQVPAEDVPADEPSGEDPAE
jgi:large subunit ribosomal protein L31